MNLNYDKDIVKQKVDCCFANAVYELYLNKRYGVNYCRLKPLEYINNLSNLKSTYDFFYKTDNNCFLSNEDIEELTETPTDFCNINHIIEQINLL